MTFNKFKLLCIGYLKPFEGKRLYELDFANYHTDDGNFHIQNIYFEFINKTFRCRYNKEIIIVNIIIFFNATQGFCRWCDTEGEFIPIEEFNLEDIV